MPVQPRSRASGERGRAVASATALTVCSSVRIAMPRKPYFALMPSPCSVTRKLPPTPARECENGEDVFGALCHADDVGTYRHIAEARAAFADRLEDIQGPCGLIVRRSSRRRSLAVLQHPSMPDEAVVGSARAPVRVAEQGCQYRAVDARVLPYVARG